jgi:hypothetical protein
MTLDVLMGKVGARRGPLVCVQVNSSGFEEWVPWATYIAELVLVRTPARVLNWREFEMVMAGA